MTNEEVLKVFKENNALLEGHFKLSSGKHSPKYLQCALVLKTPSVAEKLCSALAEKFKDEDIDLVVGPALGGVVVAYELARQLKVPSVFTERDKEGVMTLRRGFEIENGQKIIICEDVVTTGKSTKETIKVVESLGGKVAAIASLINRSDNINFDVKFESLAKVEVPVYEPDNCPLCEKDIPLVKPGSRK